MGGVLIESVRFDIGKNVVRFTTLGDPAGDEAVGAGL